MISPGKTKGRAKDVILQLAADGQPNQTTEVVSESIEISELFDRKIVNHFEREFKKSKLGNDLLTSTQFKEILCQYMPEDQSDLVYEKIDVNDEGYVSFPDFINFLISSEAGTVLAHSLHATKLIKRLEQLDDATVIHRDMIDHICFTTKPMSVLITGGRDGLVRLWDPMDLNMLANIAHEDKNTVFMKSLVMGMRSGQRAECIKAAQQRSVRERVAITSLCVLSKSGQLCVGSADSSVTIYDIGTQEVMGRITEIKEVPTAMTTFMHQSEIYEKMTLEELEQHPVFKRRLDNVLAVAGSEGGLYIYRISPDFGTYADAGAKKKNQVLMTEGLKKQSYSGKVHTDWITKITFINEIDCIATASMDGRINLFHMLHKTILRTYSGHVAGSGVKAMCYSVRQKYMVSAADRNIDVWDAHSVEQVFKFSELNAPIVDLCISDADNHIIACSTDKSMHLYNAVTFEHLQVMYDHTIYQPVNSISAICFSPENEEIYCAGNRVTAWKMQRGTHAGRTQLHGDICSVLCNAAFGLVIVVTTLGSVEVYQAVSGSVLLKFHVAPAQVKANVVDVETGLPVPIVRLACLDKRQKRLIVAKFEGEVELWNFSNGLLLQSFKPMISIPRAAAHSNPDANSTLFRGSIGSTSQTTVLGKDAIATLSYDFVQTIGKHKLTKKYVIFGTEQGVILGCEEVGTDIDNTPTMHYKRPLKLSVRKPHAHSHDVAHLDVNSSYSYGLGSQSKSAAHQPSNGEFVLSDLHLMDIDNDAEDCSVLFVLPAFEGKSLTSYADGRFIIWDMLKGNNSVELDLAPTGPLLHAMGDQHKKVTRLPGAVSGQTLTAAESTSLQPSEGLGKARVGRRVAAAEVISTAAKEPHDVDHAQVMMLHRERAQQEVERTAVLVAPANTVKAEHLHHHTLLSRRIGASTLHHVNHSQQVAAIARESNSVTQRRELATGHAVLLQPKKPSTIISHSSRASVLLQNRHVSILSGQVRSLSITTAGVLQQTGRHGVSSFAVDTNKITLADMMLSAIDSASKPPEEAVTSFNVPLPDLKPSDIVSNTRGKSKHIEDKPDLSDVSPGKKLQRKVYHREVSNGSIASDSESEVNAVSVVEIDDPAIETPNLQPAPPDSPSKKSFANTSMRSRSIRGSRVSKLSISPQSVDIRAVRSLSIHKLDKFLRTTNDSSGPIPSIPQIETPAHPIQQAPVEIHHHENKKPDDHKEHGSLDVLERLRREGATTNDDLGIDTEDFYDPEHSSIDSDGAESAGNSPPHPSQEPKELIIVDACVLLDNPTVIIGACSDGYIRFWDFDMHQVLCSCQYLHEEAPDNVTLLAAELAARTKKAHLYNLHGKRRIVPEKLRHLVLNDDQDKLIGAFDSGVIRVWAITSHSLQTLSKLMRIAGSTSAHVASVGRRVAIAGDSTARDQASNVATSGPVIGSGMAISPLQLLFEWTAHPCSISSVSFMWFNMEAKDFSGYSSSSESEQENQEGDSRNEDDDLPAALTSKPPNSDSERINKPSPKARGLKKKKKLFVNELQLGVTAEDGFIISAGLDQDIVLWTIDGDCVGRFGSEVWDINDCRTWGEREFEREPNVNTVTLDSVLSCVVTQPLKLRVKQKSGQTNSNHKVVSRNVTDLQTYVRNLVKKIAARPPLSHEQNRQFTSVLQHHPIVEVEKFVHNNSAYVTSGVADRIAKAAKSRL